jgi:TolB-like protein
MSLFAELRRRNVIRMAGLYLVGAWLIVQVASTVFPAFGLPGWALRGVIVLLAIGLVPALVFSWLYELTPEGFRRDAEVDPARSIAPQTAQRMDRLIFAGVLALIAVVALDRWLPRADPPAAAVPPVVATDTAANERSATDAATAPAAVDPNSIAVLPFVNMSAEADNEYFSDGISEELLNALVKVEGLSVASRTSSFAYKGREMGAAAIAGELKVAHILEGGVRKSGNRVRITAQLINAGSDRTLWSETFDRELTDIFAIQDEIAKAIVAALRDTLGEQASAAGVGVRADTANLQAYDLYLKARELFIARSDLRESLRLFEQVVEIDPQFARGWEGLAAVAAVMPSWRQTDRDYTALTQRAAERALALDPSLSMPWAALSFAARATLPVDYARVLERSTRAIDADPRNATAYLWRSIAWTHLGFFDRALADQEQCLRIDPAYQNCIRWNGLTYLFMGDNRRALARFQAGVEAGFSFNRAESFVAALLREGQPLAAQMLLRELGVGADLRRAIVEVAARPGTPHPDAEKLVERYLADGLGRQATQFAGSGQVYIWLGAYDGVARAKDLDGYFAVMWDPNAPGLRNSAGFKGVLERLGVVAYWREHGFPPLCRPLSGDDFECDSPARQ